MKRLIFTLLLTSSMIIHPLCQEKDTVTGKIVHISNPCLDEPCLPGTVFAIKNNTLDYIISIDASWQWSENPLIINNIILNIDDSIKAIGIISEKTDLQNRIYHEIEVDSTFFLSTMIKNIIKDNILIYPNPSEGSILIESTNSMLRGVEVFNINGKTIIFSKRNLSNTNIVVDGLKEKGIVFLQITMDNNEIITKKILIK
jgi:hypothetical protein